MRIEIAGSLASGKTTLVDVLKPAGYTIVHENLSTNPYLDLVKEYPEKYALLCQQQFVTDKTTALTEAVRTCGNVLADFSLITDRAYVAYYLRAKPEWVRLLNDQMDSAIEEMGRPGLTLYLRCAPETQLERIRSRGRAFEQGHTLGFIAEINRLVDQEIQAARRDGYNIVEIDTDKTDLLNAPGARAWLTRIIGGGSNQPSPQP